MRIISGKYRGKIINPPKNLPVRPTTDFAKTGLFNMLESRYDLSTMNCLDLFSGTGSISLELVSRGCGHVTAVDENKGCLKFLKETASKLGISNLTATGSEALKFIAENTIPFDLIFADPPFNLDIRERLCDAIFKSHSLKAKGVLIIEHDSNENYSHLKGFDFSRKYGNVTFSFFLNLALPN